MSGRPDVQTSGRPDVQSETSGRPDVLTSGRPDVPPSGRPDVRLDEFLEKYFLKKSIMRLRYVLASSSIRQKIKQRRLLWLALVMLSP